MPSSIRIISPGAALTEGQRPKLPVRDDPLRGMGLVLVAMASFSCSDAIAKFLAISLPAIEIAWLRWLVFAFIMAPGVLRSRGQVLRSGAPLLQVLRAAGLLGSALLFIAGLRFLPLATAASIGFAAPLFVTALSIPMLGEKVGVRRWAATIVGLVGVLVVVRPGSGTLGAAALLPLGSAVSWAFGMVITRRLSAIDVVPTTMTYSALVGFLALSLAVPFDWTEPRPLELALAIGMAAASTAAQFLVATAYGYAPASTLAPISYSQLVWSGLLGFLVFGGVPDLATGIGAAIIIASGLYTAHRERVRAREGASRISAEAP